jgi:crossover junction endodeoxyribonuclease RusA
LPPPSLSPNARVHWSQRCEVVATYRMIAKSRGWAALCDAEENRQPAWPPAFAMTVTLVTKNNRRRDLDNLLAACKPLIDGLVDAGLLIDDSSRYLTSITVQREVDPGCEPHVRVELRGA